MDPPADHDGEQEKRPLRSSSLPLPPPRSTRGATVGSRNITILLVLSFICFLSTFLTYNRILKPYLKIDQPPLLDYNDISVDDKQKQLLFQPTAYHKHIQLRQSNYVHHNNLTHTSKSTFGTGKNSNVRIIFQLHDPKVVPIEINKFNPYINCPLGQQFEGKRRRVGTGEIREGILPPSLTKVVQSNDHSREGRVLDFTATISTNLKILQIGDSVGLQLAQAFDEMVGCRNNVTSGNGTGFCRPRDVVWEAWRGHDGRSILSPTIGGGLSAIWR